MRHTDLKNDNKGFALTGVLVLLLILTFMGASLFAYSMISLRSVRFLSDQKKAEYLARAGVEASSYAYKLAVDSDDDNAGDLIENTTADGDEITADPVYLVYKKNVSSNPYEYVSKQDAETMFSNPDDYEVIGYYDVTIVSKSMKVPINFLEGVTVDGVTAKETEVTDKKRVFECVGHVLSGTGIELEDAVASSTKYGNMSEPVQGCGQFYDSKTGVIGGATADGADTKENLSQIGQYVSKSQLSLKLKHLSKAMTINVGSRTVPIMMGYSSGNMILNSPADGSGNHLPIKFKDNTDNIFTFAATNDLFIKSDIDATSQDGHFNVMALKGNNIVIDGNIELSVYGFTQGSALNFVNNISTVVQALQDKYRLGTVVLGTPDFKNSTVVDRHGSGTSSFGRCGRVYFGGNVYVNITMPNVGTYRYKAFSAGDAYYFQDSVKKDGTEKAYSIDLLKYFLDDAIAHKRYSENVLERFQDIIDLYYTDGENAPDPFVKVNPNNNNEISWESMRKIDKEKYGDSYRDLIPPDPTDASTLSWGLKEVEVGNAN